MNELKKIRQMGENHFNKIEEDLFKVRTTLNRLEIPLVTKIFEDFKKEVKEVIISNITKEILQDENHDILKNKLAEVKSIIEIGFYRPIYNNKTIIHKTFDLKNPEEVYYYLGQIEKPIMELYTIIEDLLKENEKESS